MCDAVYRLDNCSWCESELCCIFHSAFEAPDPSYRLVADSVSNFVADLLLHNPGQYCLLATLVFFFLYACKFVCVWCVCVCVCVCVWCVCAWCVCVYNAEA